MDTPGMDKWDETFKRHEIIESFPEENGIAREIDYLFIKMPFIMTDRDLVQESKVWKEYNGNPQNFLNVYKSTTNPKYPEKKNSNRIAFSGGSATCSMYSGWDRTYPSQSGGNLENKDNLP